MSANLSLFWSYSHADNGSDRGRVTLLAEHLANEVRVLSGMDLDLFVDRTSIEWGDEWRGRIDGALSASTFMVSVLSPTYFKRPECRKEFVDFYREADSRALDKLLLPISYVPVPDFNVGNPDEVVAIASRYQFEDWTSLRLKDPDSEEYRGSVNRLAIRLLDLHRAMTDKELEELDKFEADPESLDVGFYEALEQISIRLPGWIEAVESDIIQLAQYRAIHQAYTERLRGAPRARQLAVRHRFASDEQKVMTVALELSRNYSSVSVEMAPYVAAVLRGARESSAALESLRPLYEAVSEAKSQITDDKPEDVVAAETWRPWENLGGIFKKLIATHERSLEYRMEGNALVLEWFDDLEELFRGADDLDSYTLRSDAVTPLTDPLTES